MSGTPAVAVANPGASIPTLDTVQVLGLDVMLPGTWSGIKGGTNTYSPSDIEQAVQAFRELRNVFQPVVKLGHAADQKLIQSDGLPNAGIISNAYTEAGRLKLDLDRVPAKIAALIKSGNYGPRSLELLLDAEFGGKRYPMVIKGVALLGEDAPAVAGLNDILAMYSAPDESAAEIALSASATDTAVVELESEAAMAKPSPHDPDGNGGGTPENPDPDGDGDVDMEDGDEADMSAHVAGMKAALEAFNQHLTAVGKGKREFTVARMGHKMLGRATKDLAAKYPQSASEDTPESAADKHLSRGEETMQDDVIRTLLDIPEGQDLRTALLSLKAQNVELSSRTVELAAHNAVIAERDELRAEKVETVATAAVDKAIGDGKATEAQRGFLVNLARKDPESFAEYVATAPTAWLSGEFGSAGGAGNAINATTLEIARSMGIDEADLANRRPISERYREVIERKSGAAGGVSTMTRGH